MALIKCKECGAEISDNAKTCPQCGAPVPKKTSFLTWLVLFFFIVFFISMFNTSSNTSSTTSVDTPSAEAPSAEASAQTWKYETNTDKMTGNEAKYAQVESINTEELAFPYNGGTKMTINLRKHPRMGKDAYISVNKGQFNREYDGTSVMVKFDDQKPMKFSVVEPNDNSGDTLFFEGQKRFVENLKKAKHVIIEVEFFNQGNHQFEFNTEGLDWK